MQDSKKPDPRKKEKEAVDGGIYCMKLNGDIIYIGYTGRPFGMRWKEEYFFAYNCINGKLKEIKSSDILNAAYEMLIWAAKYGHLKTK